MVIASPWSKGGWVNSEVFDHTSCLQFLEYFLEKKTGKIVREDNISQWRRMVCGDLTTAFRPIEKVAKTDLRPVDRNAYVERIFSARNKKLPGDFVQIASQKILEMRATGEYHSAVQMQEHGWKQACALHYDLQVKMASTDAIFSISTRLDRRLNRVKPGAGIPYFVISYVPYDGHEKGKVWNFAVQDGDQLQYVWQLDKIPGDQISFALHGPNGFYRSIEAKKSGIPEIDVYTKLVSGNPVLCIQVELSALDLQLVDCSYDTFEPKVIEQGIRQLVEVDCGKSKGWYDIKITSASDPQLKLRYAGHIETGLSSYTDPLMGRV